MLPDIGGLVKRCTFIVEEREDRIPIQCLLLREILNRRDLR